MRAPQLGHNRGKRRGGNPMSKPYCAREHERTLATLVTIPNQLAEYIPGKKVFVRNERGDSFPCIVGDKIVPNRKAQAMANAAAKVIAGKYNPPREKRLSLNDNRSYAWAAGHLHAQVASRWQVGRRAVRRAKGALAS